VQRYVASEEGRAQLSRLGGTAWQRAKRKVRDDLLAMAQELVGDSRDGWRWLLGRLAAEEIAGGVVDAQLLIFEASGHMTFVEEPDVYIEAVSRFLGWDGPAPEV